MHNNPVGQPGEAAQLQGPEKHNRPKGGLEGQMSTSKLTCLEVIFLEAPPTSTRLEVILNMHNEYTQCHTSDTKSIKCIPFFTSCAMAQHSAVP